MQLNLPSLAVMVGGAAMAAYLISQVGVIFAYRAYYARRTGSPCELPLFRFGRSGPTLLDNIRRLELRDPLGWTLRAWLILHYGAMLGVALSLVAFFAGMFTGR